MKGATKLAFKALVNKKGFDGIVGPGASHGDSIPPALFPSHSLLLASSYTASNLHVFASH